MTNHEEIDSTIMPFPIIELSSELKIDSNLKSIINVLFHILQSLNPMRISSERRSQT